MREGGRRVRWAPVLWMLGTAASLVALLVHAQLRGDFDPARERRMANHPGDLAHSLQLGALELLVLVVLLRPWSYRHAPGRALLALALWLPWSLLSAAVCMHCGTVGGAHVLWRFLVVAGLFAAIIVSGLARRRAARGS